METEKEEGRKPMSTTLKPYTDYLEEEGAQWKLVDPRQVETAPWTLFKCQYGCPRYGKSRCCPPHSPDYRRTREILDSYRRGILFSVAGDSNQLAVETARRLFLGGFYKSLALGGHPCTLCESCDLESCRFPQKAIPSMEACGIDVFATARRCGFEMHTFAEKTEGPYRQFALVLVE